MWVNFERLADHSDWGDLCLHCWGAAAQRQSKHGCGLCRLRIFKCGAVLDGQVSSI